MSNPEQPAVETIAEHLATFQSEAAATRLAIQDRSEEQRRTTIWLVGFMAVMTVLVALVLVILVQNRQRSEQSRQLIRTNAELNRQIADCTSAGGQCYQQSQARSQLTINKLIESNKAIAKCARSTSTDADLDACVRRELADLPTNPNPITPSPVPAR